MAKLSSKRSLLSKSELKQIYEASLEILETVGMKIDDERFLNALEDKGAVVDYQKSTVKFPAGLVRETTKQAAKDFSERKPIKKRKPGKIQYNWGGGPAIYYLDYENQEVRRGTVQDALSIIRFADASEDIAAVSSTMLVYSTDLNGESFHPRLWTLKTTALTAKNTSKISYSENIHSVKEHEYIVEIGKVLYGSLEEVKKGRIVAGSKATISPLKLEKNACDILYYKITHGFGCAAATMPISGATAPVTLAGTIALANAEILGIWTAVKAVNPETKCGLVPWLSIMDMRSGNIVYGAPECVLQNIALAELCRYFYNVPAGINSLYTDAKLPGEQAMMERCAYGFGGIAFRVGGGISFGWLNRSQVISLEQTVVDLELVKWMGRFMEGFHVNEETLAVDAIRRVGIGGNFLADEHTVKHYRGEHWIPEIFDRGVSPDVSFKAYMESDVLKKANGKIKSVMKDYQPFRLDKYKAEEIDRIVKEAEKELLKE